MGLPGRGGGAGTSRQGQSHARIPVSPSSPDHAGVDGLGELRIPRVSAPPGCLGHIALVLVLSICRSSSVPPPPSSSWLPGLATGAGTCPGRDGMGQPDPAAAGLLPPPHAPFASHRLGISTGSSIMSVLQTVSPSSCSEPAPRSQERVLPTAAYISRAVSSSICTHFP